MYEADKAEREGFRHDVGDYLPVDLYPGINGSAPRWEFTAMEDSENANHKSTPELDRDLIAAALWRDRERQRQSQR